MRIQITKRTVAAGAALAITAAGCARQPTVTTASPPTPASPTTSSASGEVAMTTAGGMWVDSAGGTWMDTTGAMWMGHRERAIGLQPADVAAMTNANVAAHLSTGDSLEIALSESGAGRAQNADVKAFAQRMVTEHTAHRQKGATVATESSITPAPSPADTLDVTMAREMVQRLSSRAAGSDYDRQLMRDEVMMHRHMLHDLEAVRPQTSGAMQQFVDETIPVVQQHLRDAEAIRARLGDRSGGTP